MCVHASAYGHGQAKESERIEKEREKRNKQPPIIASGASVIQTKQHPYNFSWVQLYDKFLNKKIKKNFSFHKNG